MKSRIDIWALMVALLATPAGALDYDLALSAGATYSDNIGRTVGQSSTVQEDAIAELGLRLALERDAGRWRASVTSDLQYLKFLDESFDDTLQGRFDGTVEFAFVPDRFAWVVDNKFGQSFIDVLAARTPLNDENLNLFSTGPNLSLALTPSSSLEFVGRWSRLSYEVTQSDSEQTDLQLSLLHQIRDNITGSLVVINEDVRPEASSAATNYTNRTVYAQVAAVGAKTNLTARAGRSQLADTLTIGGGTIWSMEVGRQLGAHSSVTLNVGSILTNSVGSVRFEVATADGADLGTTTLFSPGAYKMNFSSVAFQTASPRNQLRISADRREYFHDISAGFNRTQTGVVLDLSRQFTVRVKGGLFGRYENTKSEASSFGFDEWSGGVEISLKFMRSFDLQFDAEHIVGKSDEIAPGIERDFEENRVSLRLVWSRQR